MKDWVSAISTAYSSNQTNNLNSNILSLIRDSLFLSSNNILKGSSDRGVHGFVIYSKKDFDLYEYFLRLCRNAFWLSKKYSTPGPKSEFENESKLSSIYTLDFAEYSGVSFSNFCFTNRNYLVTCCCERCTRVLDYLDKNHHDSLSSENLKKLLVNEQNSLTKFLIHNKQYQTLEYKLLKISFNGLIIKKIIKDQFHSLFNGPESCLKSLFQSCLVLCKNFELISDYSSEESDNHLGVSSLVLDLLCEYAELWEELDLPIFSFILLQVENSVPTNQPVTQDDSLYSNPCSLLSNSNHFKYFNIVYDEVINENSKVEYFKDFLKSICNKQGLDNFNVLRALLRLTRGYRLEDLKVLTRLAMCESVKDKCDNFYEEVVKYFEKAVSLKPMVEFSHDIGLAPEVSSFSNFLNFSPLKLQNGQVVCRKGLESMVLQLDTLEKVTSFLSQHLPTGSSEHKNTSIALAITGDSGVGKTTLAHCLAQEMNSVFFPVNVLSFLRPQVGLSEKLFHSFISKIRNHFSGSATGSRRDLVKCVILLEGLEALNGNEGYLKRLTSGLRSEFDSISTHSKFSSDYSILLVTTCHRLSDLPEKIRMIFTEFIPMKAPTMDEKFAQDCFELFLNLRCDFMDRMGDLIEYVSKRNYLGRLTPLKIATISKNASLQTAADSSLLSNSELWSSKSHTKTSLVCMETLISVLDSTLS
ncbi:hypothetical protein MACK_003119 [Theileria orientalis]|uniref:AAA+ ATPase domain-containing protein n=1 Tax=Theileria orientalis TaxID=68886 RepID=A0A976QU79_THEOR|nr:hypothetical protein MACK_003119 [Theileria orientalis]